MQGIQTLNQVEIGMMLEIRNYAAKIFNKHGYVHISFQRTDGSYLEFEEDIGTTQEIHLQMDFPNKLSLIEFLKKILNVAIIFQKEGYNHEDHFAFAQYQITLKGDGTEKTIHG